MSQKDIDFQELMQQGVAYEKAIGIGYCLYRKQGGAICRYKGKTIPITLKDCLNCNIFIERRKKAINQKTEKRETARRKI